MLRALWTAATGMFAQQLNVDNISNNLANVNTTGYKKSRVEFQDLFYQTLKEAGSPLEGAENVPTQIQVGLGTNPVATLKLYSQGDLQNTENPMDVAITGDGFFQITLPTGDMAYSRAGAFKLDAAGNMVTSDGYLLEPGIVIPQDATDMAIGPDGTVSVMLPGNATPSVLGQIELAKFIFPSGLKSIGQNLYLATEASGVATTGLPGESGYGQLKQGFLEMSNVRVVDEMVQMILAQRAYEMNSKSIQTADRMIEMSNNLVR